jgi:hypothetical protein
MKTFPLSSLVFSVLLSACVIIPTPQHYIGGRLEIGDPAINALTPGVATKEDILLGLGEPDLVAQDEAILGYRWQKAQAYFFAGGPGGGVGGPIMTSYMAFFQFGRDNTLLRHDVIRKTLWTRSLLDEALRW